MEGFATFKGKILSLLFYFVVVLPVQWLRVVFERYTSRSHTKRTEKRYLGILATTEDYATWLQTARNLDKLRGFDRWQHEKPVEDYCDAENIVMETMTIQRLLEAGNRQAAAEFLRTHLHRNANGLASPMLFRYYTGTKRFVENYNSAVLQLIDLVVRNDGLAKHEGAEQADASASATVAPLVTGSLRSKLGDVLAPLRVSQYTKSIVEWAEANPKLDTEESDQWTMLADTYRAYGRSALMLSGGATLGMYHTGVIRALWDAKLLPQIISGSSAGAIIASIFFTRTDTEIAELLSGDGLSLASVSLDAFGDSSIDTKLERLARSGAFMDVTTLMECLRKNCGDITFLEAFMKTGRVLNISVAAEKREGDKEMLLNYITAPDVVIWSAVSASCAMPGLFTAVQLLKKTIDAKGREHLIPHLDGQLWYDGSVACDLPRKELSTLFNVNYFIVSQTNPHVIPFLRNPPSPLVHKRRPKFTKVLWFALCDEAKYWIKKLYRFGLLPRSGGAELPYLLATQTYSGDITILPIGSVWRAIPDFVNLTSNPSQEHMEYVISNAQRRTWPHINQIRCVTEIERKLSMELAQRSRKNTAGVLRSSGEIRSDR